MFILFSKKCINTHVTFYLLKLYHVKFCFRKIVMKKGLVLTPQIALIISQWISTGVFPDGNEVMGRSNHVNEVMSRSNYVNEVMSRPNNVNEVMKLKYI